ncbi:MAG TPA: hypothetical protein EYN06_01990 [Myxococcales bacterium]|nr:hypothetical protein [Myxococcales bacterium]HIN85222.1 hypothetical protein [Myxococcales bacterium]
MVSSTLMILDIAISLWVSARTFRGRDRGIGAESMRTAVALLVGFLALFAAPPVGRVINKVFGWTPNGIDGLSFLFLFGLFYMVGYFAIETAANAMEYSERNGVFDEIGGAVFSGLRTTLIAYALLSGVMMTTRDLGASKSKYAFNYSQSYVGRYTLTHNFMDKEPFPHAQLLNDLVQRGSKSGITTNRHVALAGIGSLPSANFLNHDANAESAIRTGNWHFVRKHRELLALICDHAFLDEARRYYLNQVLSQENMPVSPNRPQKLRKF